MLFFSLYSVNKNLGCRVYILRKGNALWPGLLCLPSVIQERCVVTPHFPLQRFCFSVEHFVEHRPEARPVVHLHEVRQFVLKDVVLEVARK